MSQIGPGVMINNLCGDGETRAALLQAAGKEIVDVAVTPDNTLRIAFVGGSGLRLWDDGQSCCEDRYMHTDDALQDFAGAKFLRARIEAAPPIETDYDCHEVQFLIIDTSKGSFTVETHNEHNGYYGGFAVEARMFGAGD